MERHYRVCIKIDDRWMPHQEINAASHKAAFNKMMLLLERKYFDKPIRLERD
jgi:hypothetical protein